MGSRVRLLAQPPEMPPVQGLAPATYERGPTSRGVVVWFTVMLIGIAVGFGLTVAQGPGEGFVVTVLAPLGLYQALGARRAYMALGPGWIYARTEAFGRGKWCRFQDLIAVKRVTNPRGPDQLVLRAGNGAVFRFSLADSRRPTALRMELARQLMTAGVTIDASLYQLVSGWSASQGQTA